MNYFELKNNLHRSIEMFAKNDYYLIENNLNERTIAHKLGEYLQILFPDYNVDCEYNRDIEQATGIKSLNILKERYETVKNKKINDMVVDGRLSQHPQWGEHTVAPMQFVA